jgi:hypothetical protein
MFEYLLFLLRMLKVSIIVNHCFIEGETSER